MVIVIYFTKEANNIPNKKMINQWPKDEDKSKSFAGAEGRMVSIPNPLWS